MIKKTVVYCTYRRDREGLQREEPVHSCCSIKVNSLSSTIRQTALAEFLYQINIVYLGWWCNSQWSVMFQIPALLTIRDNNVHLCKSTNNVAPCTLWDGGVIISDVRWFKSQHCLPSETMDVHLCKSTNNVAPCKLWVSGVMISDVRWFKFLH